MNKNGVFLPDTIREKILGYTGWDYSFEEFAKTVGKSCILPTSNQKEWWYTGGIRTRFLEGPFHRETIVYDGHATGEGKPVYRDITQRRLFRLFTYLRACATQDPMASALYETIGTKPPRVGPDITNEDEASRYFTQREYLIVSNNMLRISLLLCNSDEEDRILDNPSTALMANRGSPNYSLTYMNNGDDPISLAWKFSVHVYHHKLNSFWGIHASQYCWSSLSNHGEFIVHIYSKQVDLSCSVNITNGLKGLQSDLYEEIEELEEITVIIFDSGLFIYERYI